MSETKNIGFNRDGKFIVKIENIDIGCSYLEEWMKFGKVHFAMGDSLEQAAMYPSWKDAFDALAAACVDGVLDEDERDLDGETLGLKVFIDPADAYE